MRKLALLAAVAALAVPAASTHASTTSSASAPACIYVLEDVECIDPYREALEAACSVGDRLGWYCLYSRQGEAR
jgi:hypothetical protein